MTIRVFVSGQSNALGRDTGGPEWGGINNRVRVWDNANPLGANGTAWRTAEVARTSHATFEYSNRNNFAVWFCHRLAQVRGDDVDMTLVARGATAIEGWGTSAPSVPMLDQCGAVYAATGQEAAHVFLWHQGENDVSTDPATYKADFLTLVSNLSASVVIDAKTIIILGGLSEDNQSRIDFNTNVLQELAEENQNIYFANSSGLPTYDGTHFTGDSLYTLGAERFFAAYTEGFGMADLFALVNEGGEPGVPGSGENKLYNLLNLALIGMGAKDIAASPSFTGALPADGLLAAGMVAAGAIVEYGTTTNGSFWRFESGLQICAHRAATTVTTSITTGGIFGSSSQNFVFPRPFSSIPSVSPFAQKTSGSGLAWASYGTDSLSATGVGIAAASSLANAVCVISYNAVGQWK